LRKSGIQKLIHIDRFKKVGQLEFAGIDPSRRNDLMDAAITAGAEDIVDKSDNQIAVVCAPEEFAEVKTALKDSGFEASSGDIVFVPVSQVDISQDEYDQVFSFIQELEALDDVEDISHDAA
jgi:transcriptional/translational regulatory protein YebC/TACO1